MVKIIIMLCVDNSTTNIFINMSTSDFKYLLRFFQELVPYVPKETLALHLYCDR
jgi:hypothetical protein